MIDRALIRLLQAILTYLLVAVLVGALAGLFLFATTTFINHILGIDETTDRNTKERQAQRPTRSVAEYRAERKRKRHAKEPRHTDQLPISPASGDGFGGLSGLNVGGDSFESAWVAARGQPLQLSEQTILEEEDSSAPFE
jgi:hypothetical protein